MTPDEDLSLKRSEQRLDDCAPWKERAATRRSPPAMLGITRDGLRYKMQETRNGIRAHAGSPPVIAIGTSEAGRSF